MGPTLGFLPGKQYGTAHSYVDSMKRQKEMKLVDEPPRLEGECENYIKKNITLPKQPLFK